MPSKDPVICYLLNQLWSGAITMLEFSEHPFLLNEKDALLLLNSFLDGNKKLADSLKDANFKSTKASGVCVNPMAEEISELFVMDDKECSSDVLIASIQLGSHAVEACKGKEWVGAQRDQACHALNSVMMQNYGFELSLANPASLHAINVVGLINHLGWAASSGRLDSACEDLEPLSYPQLQAKHPPAKNLEGARNSTTHTSSNLGKLLESPRVRKVGASGTPQARNMTPLVLQVAGPQSIHLHLWCSIPTALLWPAAKHATASRLMTGSVARCRFCYLWCTSRPSWCLPCCIN